MNKIEVENLTVRYKDGGRAFTALENVSFAVEEGQFVGVIGSSGCGKSTLLSVLGGLRPPSSGRAAVNGDPISGPGPGWSMVFQHYSLFPWMTVLDNVTYGIRQVKKGLARGEMVRLAESFLEKVGLDGFKRKFPEQLSGGMRQRAAIARSLAMDTEILLMDEPFGAVDAKNRTYLQELLLKLWEGAGPDELVVPLDYPVARGKRKTIIFVTHDIDEAILMSDRIIMLTGSPGKVYKDIHVPFARPRKRAVLIQTPEYTRLRNELFALFFNDFGSDI
ncbi:MAG: ABC transporter ATP-binding protein [Spirochaetaceae bacterium]|jgi:NitT/TauT family transport system ATP-binding protein|nr:ABC transporter ATP-binding protein [Spirochaetaceae bacterium]